MLFFRIEAIKRALDENNYWRECRCFLNLQIETQGKKTHSTFLTSSNTKFQNEVDYKH